MLIEDDRYLPTGAALESPGKLRQASIVKPLETPSKDKQSIQVLPSMDLPTRTDNKMDKEMRRPPSGLKRREIALSPIQPEQPTELKNEINFNELKNEINFNYARSPNRQNAPKTQQVVTRIPQNQTNAARIAEFTN